MYLSNLFQFHKLKCLAIFWEDFGEDSPILKQFLGFEIEGLAIPYGKITGSSGSFLETPNFLRYGHIRSKQKIAFMSPMKEHNTNHLQQITAGVVGWSQRGLKKTIASTTTSGNINLEQVDLIPQG